MSIYSRKIAANEGLELFAFPQDQSLGNWVTYRASGTEDASPDTGRYTFSLESDNGIVWEIFQGTGQPNNWGETIGNVSLSVPVSLLIETGIQDIQSTVNSIETGVAGINALSATGVQDIQDNMIRLGNAYDWVTSNGTVTTTVQ